MPIKNKRRPLPPSPLSMSASKKRRVESPIHDPQGRPLMTEMFNHFYINLIKEHTQLRPGPHLHSNAERRAHVHNIFKFVSEFRVKDKYPIDESAAFLASHIFDCAMSTIHIPPSDVPVAVFASIFIACKNFDVWFKLKYLKQRCVQVGQTVDAAQLLAMEPKLLMACKYDVHVITTIDMTRSLGMGVHRDEYLILKYLTRIFYIHRISPEGVERSTATPSLVIEACCELAGIKLKQNNHRPEAIADTATTIRELVKIDIQIKDSYLNVAFKDSIAKLKRKNVI